LVPEEVRHWFPERFSVGSLRRFSLGSLRRFSVGSAELVTEPRWAPSGGTPAVIMLAQEEERVLPLLAGSCCFHTALLLWFLWT